MVLFSFYFLNYDIRLRNTSQLKNGRAGKEDPINFDENKHKDDELPLTEQHI